MQTVFKVPDKGDPSDILQLFPGFNLQLLCCRYWWLKSWEFKELSYPYWRIYRNLQPGASIIFNNKEYKLNPDKIILIAPNTSYATRLFNNKIPANGYRLNGGRVSAINSEQPFTEDERIFHLFIHFNLGMPYDNIAPGIFEFNISQHLEKKLTTITNHLKVEFGHFNFFTVLAIQSLIGDLLSEIPESNWDLMSNDYRILEVLSYIENNMGKSLTNVILAKKARLATNAFTRLFVEEIGISPQRYIKKKRTDRACMLLHHFNYSIEKVANETGFSDRYHFSKVFKSYTGVSPAIYRKGFVVK